MKLQTILGAALTVGAIALSSATVFAADAYTVGAPIDLATGAAATGYTAGQHIAVPVDLATDNGNIEAFQVVVEYNSSLTPAVAIADLSGTEISNLQALDLCEGNGFAFNDDTTKVNFVKGIVSKNALTQKYSPVALTDLYNPNYDTNKIFYTGTAVNTFKVNTAGPEFYFLFNVVSDIDTSKLNVSIAEVDIANSMVNSEGSSVYDLPSESEAKTNTCGAAFKLVLDSETMDYYVHSLTLKVNGVEKGKITEYVENGKKFEFPVRLIGTAPETVSITVEAETGTATEITGTKTLIDNQALTLNPTDYAEF